MYAEISPQELDANDDPLATSWDPSQPFEVVVTRIQETIAYAVHAQEPISDSHIVRVAYVTILPAGVFTEDCRRWRELPGGEDPPPNWAEFKKHFRQAHRQWELTTGAGTSSGAFAAATFGPEPPAAYPFGPEPLTVYLPPHRRLPAANTKDDPLNMPLP